MSIDIKQLKPYVDSDGLKVFLDALKSKYVEPRLADLIAADAELLKKFNDLSSEVGDANKLAEVIIGFIAAYNQHTHTVNTVSGIDIGFTGNTVTSEGASDTITIKHLENNGQVPTRKEVAVPTSAHTHKVSVTADGQVESGFTGDAASHNHIFEGSLGTTSESGLTVNYANGTLNISSAHTHTLTPSGNISQTSITPSGSIQSNFTGRAVEATTVASTNTQTIYEIDNVGSMPTFIDVSVATADHTHNVTTEGSIRSELKTEQTSVSTPSPTFEISNDPQEPEPTI